jgi:hypothetical protein
MPEPVAPPAVPCRVTLSHLWVPGHPILLKRVHDLPTEWKFMTSGTQNALANFSIEKDGDAYLLNIEDDAGQTIKLSASFEQVELLADTLDDLLGADDSGAAVETDDPS